MAETRRYALGNHLDIDQILLEAQHRWLRPAEICEILRNYTRFRIASEPANMPPSGSLFLFDRKVLRYFRKDGHSWRKKKDGKTVKEAHERLKAGSIDVLHCYYAHGEENENFQRRSYWMLEDDLSHIVLVHYREVKGNRTHVNRSKGAEGAIPCSHETEATTPNNSGMDTSFSSSFHPNSYQVPSQATDTISNSAQGSEYEDAESAYTQQASSSLRSFLELQQPVVEKVDAGLSDHYYPVSFSNDYQGKLSGVPGMEFISYAQLDRGKGSREADLTYETPKPLEFSWEDVLENSNAGIQPGSFPLSLSTRGPNSVEIIPKEENALLSQLFIDNFAKSQDFRTYPHIEGQLQTLKADSSEQSGWSLDQKGQSNLTYDLANKFNEHDLNASDGRLLKLDSATDLTLEGKPNYSSAIRRHLLDGSLTDDGLKKLDSFNRWMSKELGDVSDLQMQSSSGAYWDTVEGEDGIAGSSSPSPEQLDACPLGPSLSQDQFFSIIDFSPNWAYAGSEIKVLITGRFLKSQQETEKCKWSCMFGEVEVPAEVIADGVLRCYAPAHKAGRVPFYVTCSNRLACSEVREFEYQVNHSQDMDAVSSDNSSATDALHMRFGKLLCLNSACPPSNAIDKNSPLSIKIASLLKDDNDEWDQMLKLSSEEGFATEKLKEQLLQKVLKEKLHIWLLQKAAEGGKGPNVLDEGGQGVLHFAAALGYDWAIRPIVLAGVSANFRDVNGWTALHWAAVSGRERTVAVLISNDAAPGLVTDPTPEHPSGRTPADLASANGHKGIAGYLAEASLTSHLSSLNLDTKEGDAAETPGGKAVQTVSERTATPITDGDLAYGLSMKDSLAAVCNATQAAARIHQVFRVQSFQKKQLKEYGGDKKAMSDEELLSLLAMKTHKQGQHDDSTHSAAVRIQNKFRSWKGRKDFLIIRQRIVKIQAHVRGHQVRKNYKKITWSVGILEKVILRWRRKGSGLRGFKPEALTEGSSMQDTSSKEDDYDFLKEGRKQTEQRLQKALARVKSMVQYPEARDQYRRLLNVVTEIQETEAADDKVINDSEEANDFYDDLIDLEALLDDDTHMATAQ